MDLENPAGRERRLNNAVSITVVLLSVFMAVSKVKDDNIVQAMQQAKADAVDTWAQYQTKKLKMHLAEVDLHQAGLLKAINTSEQNRDIFAGEMAHQQQLINQYVKEADELQKKAQGLEASYDALNFHDDQFDMSDALLSIALAIAAVSSLVSSWRLLCVGWAAGSAGLLFGLAGFAGWAIHPDWLSALLS